MSVNLHPNNRLETDWCAGCSAGKHHWWNGDPLDGMAQAICTEAYDVTVASRATATDACNILVSITALPVPLDLLRLEGQT
jgi:hypothetical protein